MTYRVFISSRNNDMLFINGKQGISLTDIRLYLKQELEKEKIFNNEFLEIIINESFNTDSSNDSYSECLKQIEDSNYTIALYNGNSGWAPPSIDKGICHAELAKAIEISQKQVSILDITSYFKYDTTDTIQLQRDELFKSYIQTYNRFSNPLKIPKSELTEQTFKTYLLQKIKEFILKSIEKRIDASTYYFKLNGSTQKLLEWKGLNFENRNKEITTLLSNMIRKDYEDVITVIKSIPENMSTKEALNFTGRSFLNDQDTIGDKKNKKLKKGPIHFVGVFGNVTETQIKVLIGNPDITTIKDDFGIYVWERSLNIQMVFLTKCSTPEATTTNYNLFRIWSESNEQSNSILKRAEARHLIINAFIKAHSILT